MSRHPYREPAVDARPCARLAGWFLHQVGEHAVRYAWGFGGQMLYIVPSLELTVVMTSDENRPSARTGYRDELNALMAETIAAISGGPSRASAG